MARPLSMDLRERAMMRLDEGESVREVASALSVAPSSVVKWRQRRRATGSVEPGRMGGHVPCKIRGEHAIWMRERIASGAFTLHGLVAELAAREVKADYRTVWKFVRRTGVQLQKKHLWRARRTGRTWPATGRAGSAIRAGWTRGGSCSSMKPGARPTWRRSAAGRRRASG